MFFMLYSNYSAQPLYEINFLMFYNAIYTSGKLYINFFFHILMYFLLGIYANYFFFPHTPEKYVLFFLLVNSFILKSIFCDQNLKKKNHVVIFFFTTSFDFLNLSKCFITNSYKTKS